MTDTTVTAPAQEVQTIPSDYQAPTSIPDDSQDVQPSQAAGPGAAQAEPSPNPGAGLGGTADLENRVAQNNAAMANPVPAPVPKHRSILSAILHAIGDVMGGPKTTQTVDPETGAITNTPLNREQRIANTAGMYIRGIGAGLAQHGPGATGKAVVAGGQAQMDYQKQQSEDTLAQSKNIQQQVLNRATIAYQNNQTLLAWRKFDMEGAEFKQRVNDSDRAFDLQMQQAGGTQVPMIVDGKDMNGTDNEIGIMSWMTNHPTAPKGYDYVPTREIDDKGKTIYKVLQVPHDAMNDMVTVPTKDAKAMGIPVNTTGDSVTMRRGALVAARSQNLKDLNEQSDIKAHNAAAAKDTRETNLLGTVTEKDRFDQGQEDLRASMKVAAEQGTKIQSMVNDESTKGPNSYSTFASENAALSDTLQRAKITGDEVASAFAKTMGIQGVNSIADMKRISPVEAQKVEELGSAGREFWAKVTKFTQGELPASTMKELQALQVNLSNVKYRGYVANMMLVSKKDPNTQILDQRGTNLVPLGAVMPDTGQAKGSDGRTYWVTKQGQVLGEVK